MIVLLLQLLLLSGPALAQDLDPDAIDQVPTTAPDAPPAVDTDPPTDTDAPADTDTPADTEAPPPADTDTPAATDDTDVPPRLSWTGMDDFIGPLRADGGPRTGKSTQTPADTDSTPAPTPRVDPAHGPPRQPDDIDTDADHGGADTGAPHDTGAPDDTDAATDDTDSPTSAAPAAPAPAEQAPDLLTRDIQTWLPWLPLRGWRVGLALGLATLLCWGLARVLGPLRDWLAPTGVLPTLASGVQQFLRVLALFFAFGVIAAIIPANLEPALPWVVLAGAVALGWSTRDVAPDFVAGLVLAAERRIRPGRWIGTSKVSGVVEQVSLRVTWVRDATGRRVAVPNRTFLTGAVVTDRGRWPSIEVVLRVPGQHTPSAIRRVVEDAVLVSPWTAPLPPEMVREEQEVGLWRVRARVLEGRFADRFEGALREHVEEALQVGTGLRDRLASTRPRTRVDPQDAPEPQDAP